MLPGGIFSGLPNLRAVNVADNPKIGADPLTLTVTPVITVEPSGNDSGTAVIRVLRGVVPFAVPFAVRATVSIERGDFPGGTPTVMIKKGETQSLPFEFTVDPNEISTVITVSNLMSDPQNIRDSYGVDNDGILMGYSGFQLVGEPLFIGGGICRRTDQIQAAILATPSVATALGPSIAGVDDCNRVTNELLLGIDGTLGLSSQSIAALQSGDFAGLTNLTTLDLSENDFAMLPVGIFSPLTNLTYLNLSDLSRFYCPRAAFARRSIQWSYQPDDPGFKRKRLRYAARRNIQPSYQPDVSEFV